jgi:hypothetical protein
VSPWLQALIVVGALAVSVGGGWWLVPLLLRAASRSADAGPVDDVAPGEGDRTREPGTPSPPTAALRGGTWIGALERAAVTGALLAGYPAGIAFVIAGKGLGRYPELREHPGSSERFVIGTLGSLVWSAAIGAVGAVVLGTRVLGV